MSFPADCSLKIAPNSMPVEFSLLCRSLLVHDSLYGRLMTEELPPTYESFAPDRFSDEQENSPFLIIPKVSLADRAHNS